MTHRDSPMIFKYESGIANLLVFVDQVIIPIIASVTPLVLIIALIAGSDWITVIICVGVIGLDVLALLAIDKYLKTQKPRKTKSEIKQELMYAQNCYRAMEEKYEALKDDYRAMEKKYAELAVTEEMFDDVQEKQPCSEFIEKADRIVADHDKHFSNDIKYSVFNKSGDVELFAVSGGLAYEFDGYEFVPISKSEVLLDFGESSYVTEEEAMRISSGKMPPMSDVEYSVLDEAGVISLFAIFDGMSFKFDGSDFAPIRTVGGFFDLRESTPVTEEEAMRISSGKMPPMSDVKYSVLDEAGVVSLFAWADDELLKFNGSEFVPVRTEAGFLDFRESTVVTEEEAMQISSGVKPPKKKKLVSTSTKPKTSEPKVDTGMFSKHELDTEFDRPIAVMEELLAECKTKPTTSEQSKDSVTSSKKKLEMEQDLPLVALEVAARKNEIVLSDYEIGMLDFRKQRLPYGKVNLKKVRHIVMEDIVRGRMDGDLSKIQPPMTEKEKYTAENYLAEHPEIPRPQGLQGGTTKGKGPVESSSSEEYMTLRKEQLTQLQETYDRTDRHAQELAKKVAANLSVKSPTSERTKSIPPRWSEEALDQELDRALAMLKKRQEKRKGK